MRLLNSRAAAWDHLLALSLGDVEFITDNIAELVRALLVPIRVRQQDRAHQRLETRDRHWPRPYLDSLNFVGSGAGRRICTDTRRRRRRGYGDPAYRGRSSPRGSEKAPHDRSSPRNRRPALTVAGKEPLCRNFLMPEEGLEPPTRGL